ncbi:hypothetical protein [Streptomyces sp. NPDC039028]
MTFGKATPSRRTAFAGGAVASGVVIGARLGDEASFRAIDG